MRKVICLAVCALLLAGCLCACGESTNTENPSAPESTVSDAVTSEPPAETATEAEMRTLFDRNLKCLTEIFELSTLSYERTPVRDRLHKVTDPDFKTFDALQSFVYGTYVKETGDSLFADRIEGHPLYRDLDGVLVIDESAIGGKGYYVDWKDYTLKITDATADRCTFTVTATVEWPADEPVKESYEKTAVAVKQDGQWLLTERVY